MSELKNLFGLKGTEEEVANWFMENYNLRMVVLTAGADYSTVYTPDEVSTLATPKVDVVDTVGAGDAFAGALLHSLVRGFEPQKLIDFSISASVLKLMIQRDFNLVTENEIMRVMESKAANLQR